MNIFHIIKQKLTGGKSLPVTYNQDGLTTIHNAGFMHLPDFKLAEAAGAATGSWKNIHWRVHTVLWAAYHCRSIEGDFVECGTNKGGFARAICEYIDLSKYGKKFYLLDTFKGIVENLLTKEERQVGKKEHFEKEYDDCYDQVIKTFAPYPYVKLIRGVVPDVLPQVNADKLAFLSIDMNSIVPEIAALKYFWPKMSPGGIIVLDDYAYATCDLQYKAHNEWANANGIKILSIPTGQGLIIK